MAMKYIVIKTHLGKVPVMFSGILSHDDVARALSKPMKIISAGFVDIVDGVVSAHGHSSSLGIQSDPRDSALIEQYLYESEY